MEEAEIKLQSKDTIKSNLRSSTVVGDAGR